MGVAVVRNNGSSEERVTNARRRNRSTRWTDIYEAAKNGDVDAIRTFVENEKVDVNSVKAGKNRTPLGAAADAGHLGAVQYLVSKGANVNAKDRDGYTPLLLALVSDNADIELIKVLVEKGADVNVKAASDGFTALHWAAANNRVDAISFLLDNGANKNARNRNNATPLLLAASKGNLDVVDDLINNRGVRLNDDIFSAAKNGYVGLIKYFVERRSVDPFAKNQNGDTALHEAASYGHTNVVKYFLDEKSADVNLQNRRGETPLLVAARNGQLGVIRYLLDEGNADITARDNGLNDVLHKAAESGQLTLVKYLVEERNLDTYTKNKSEQTPLLVAKANNRNDIVRYFVNVKGMPEPTISKLSDSDRHRSQPTSTVQKQENSPKPSYYPPPPPPPPPPPITQLEGNDLSVTTIEETDNNGRKYKYTLKEAPITYSSGSGGQTFFSTRNKPTQFMQTRPDGYWEYSWKMGPDGRVTEQVRGNPPAGFKSMAPAGPYYGGQQVNTGFSSGRLRRTGTLSPGGSIFGISGPNGGGGQIDYEFSGSEPGSSGTWHESYSSFRRKRDVSSVDRNDPVITHTPFFTPGNLPSMPSGRVNDFSSQPQSVNGLLNLLDVSARRITGNHYQSPKHESLLTPPEILERKFDHNAITAIKGIKDFENV